MRVLYILAVFTVLVIFEQGITAQKDPCSQPKKVGPCLAAMTRFFYNKKTKKCKKFTYGGCHGNGNNFKSRKECNQKCSPLCNDPKDPGNCKATIPRFFYNNKTGQCEKFIYGGCGGNKNNFKTLRKCRRKCDTNYVG